MLSAPVNIKEQLWPNSLHDPILIHPVFIKYGPRCGINFLGIYRVTKLDTAVCLATTVLINIKWICALNLNPLVHSKGCCSECATLFQRSITPWCLDLESKVIPFLESSWNKVSKTVQDFDNWTKIDGVMGKKLRVGQFQNLHFTCKAISQNCHF